MLLTWNTGNYEEEDAQFVETLDTDSDYIDRPVVSNAEYVRTLVSLARVHRRDIGNTNKQGASSLKVLRSGATYDRYAWLQNGACRVGSISDAGRSLLAMGATGSEALRLECCCC